MLSTACFPPVLKLKLRTVCYPFPCSKAYKKAESVGWRQGSQARPFFFRILRGTDRGERSIQAICQVANISER